jgi:hypothetical protein
MAATGRLSLTLDPMGISFKDLFCEKLLNKLNILHYYPLANEAAKGYSNATFRNILVNTRINILQWILTKLGTYLVLKKIWNPIDFQGQRSQDQIYRHGDMPRFALPLFGWSYT